MSLTGIPLILLGEFGSLAAVAVTMRLWNQFGWVRYLLRATGVLVAEVLLLSTIGLVANRSQQFYPTWDTLLDSGATDSSTSSTTNGMTYRSGPGDLDHELAVRANGRTGEVQTFSWQTADWRRWGLAAAPAVLTPPGYLLHPTWSYSAVVVIGAGPIGRRSAEEQSAARRAIATGVSAVVVFATTTAATTAQTLAVALPDQLGRDLRVTSHRWAMVASASDASLAQNAVLAAAARYPSIVLVAARITTKLALPAGITCAAVVVSNTVATYQAGVEPLLSTAPDALFTALSWAIERTPPPLAASPPPGAHVPAGRRKPAKPFSPHLGDHDANPPSPVSPRR